MRTTARKAIVILIDGLSADYFEQHRANLPHLCALASQGLHVQRLRSPVPATSMPGRVSMITGEPSQRHGVFGNHVFDGQSFRCAMPSDIVVPTIAQTARATGLNVASVGYAMVRPEHTDFYYPAWWLRSFMRHSRFAKALNESVVSHLLSSRHSFEEMGVPGGEPEEAASRTADRSLELMRGAACDQRIVRMIAALACSDSPPDLILGEIALPDHIQHLYGFESEAAHWSLSTADLLVGFLLHRLELAGRRDDYVVAVTSDHGHSPISTAIYPDVVLGAALWQSEGATLHVAVRDSLHRREVERRLLEVGAEPMDGSHIPAGVRDCIATFAAPDRHSFEQSPNDHDGLTPSGPPAAISSHGLRPGTPADDRFCVFAGPSVIKSEVPDEAAEWFCPTLARTLGLPGGSQEESLA